MTDLSSLAEPIERIEFSARTKALAFKRSCGKCESCDMDLQTGRIEYDHIIPARLGGKAEVANCQVLCKSCHQAKYQADMDNIKRARRLARKSVSAVPEKRKIPSRPLPAGKTPREKLPLSAPRQLYRDN